jgi:hypothetical protein
VDNYITANGLAHIWHLARFLFFRYFVPLY